MKKFILDCSDREILSEVEKILGHRVVPRKERLGYITNDKRVYVKPDGSINEAKLRWLYDAGPEVEDYIVTLSLTSLRNRPAALFRLIRKTKPGDKVLEYGCGTSTHGVACAQLGADVHVLDISSRMLAFARERYRLRGLSVTTHTSPDTLPKDTFDIVICSDVIEHVPDPVATAKHIWASMRPGGIVHFHVSYHVNFDKGHLLQAISSWRKFEKDGLQKLFKKVGKFNYEKV